MPKPQETFKIGLCMAGAISAGAYTAGVMDYLVEALEEWQKRKDANIPGTPNHDVEISILGGASAGGMTSCPSMVLVDLSAKNLEYMIISWEDQTAKNFFVITFAFQSIPLMIFLSMVMPVLLINHPLFQGWQRAANHPHF